MRKNRENILIEWQPPRVGFLAAIYICGPHVGSCSRHRHHGDCLFWGVTFWQSEKLLATV